jgi:hypothetical protein
MVSPTLELARHRVAPQDQAPRPVATAGAVEAALEELGPAVSALAVVVSWLAAGALVIGLVWVASAMSPKESGEGLEGTLPYALGWSVASLAMLVSSVASLFVAGRRRLVLLGTALALCLTLAAVTLVANALAG